MKAKTRALIFNLITYLMFCAMLGGLATLFVYKWEQDQAVQIQVAQDYLAEYHDGH